MSALDWSRYRAVSGQAGEVDASRLCDSRDPVDRAMGEALARDYGDFSLYDDPEPWWVPALAWAAWGFIALGAAATALGVLWLLMAHVLPAIPWAVALLIQAGGETLATWH